jgi:amino-acid N-acetyltransferase
MKLFRPSVVRVRKAILPDASAIHGLIFEYSRSNDLLPRTLPELYENIRDFTVAEDGKGILGCGALHFYGMHLGEVRSIAVWPRLKGRGIGTMIVDALLAEADQHRIPCACLFTRTPAFFRHMGFAEVARERLPDKLYKDCNECRRRENCDEVAMVRGRLPSLAKLELDEKKPARRSLSRVL